MVVSTTAPDFNYPPDKHGFWRSFARTGAERTLVREHRKRSETQPEAAIGGRATRKKWGSSIRRVVVAGMALVHTLGCADGDTNGNDGASDRNVAGQSSVLALSHAEVDSLLFIREEEKLARDVYNALSTFGNPFTSIQNSEQSHMDAVLVLLDAYGLPDPAAGKGSGEFENTELQSLHDALVTQGLPSQIAALTVGCAIEELDIRDIELAKTSVAHDDITATYDMLVLGSRNHLRAFYGKLDSLGGSYVPQYLDQASFDAIVNSPRENQ